MDPNQYYDTNEALDALTRHLGVAVRRPTLGAWVANGYLPGVSKASGRAIFIPKAAVPLFRLPGRGRYKRREHLARGVGIALQTLGQARVAGVDGVVGAVCPRCGGPWVIRGSLPTVSGHEADLCCCNLACLYIGPDFLYRADDRVSVRDGGVYMRA
jgi:hypothetical protein